MSRWEVNVEPEKTRKAGIWEGQCKDEDGMQKRRKGENRSLLEDGIETCSPMGHVFKLGNSELKNVAALLFSFP